MMKKAALILLLLASLLFAYEDTGEFGDYLTETLDSIRSSGEDFVVAGEVAAGAGSSAFTSLYYAFTPGYCGDDWAQNDLDVIVNVFLGPAAMTAIIIAFALTSIYLIGILMQLPHLIALAKEEGFQLGMTVIRIVFLVGILSAGNWWYLFSVEGGTDPIYMNHDTMIDASMAFCRQMTVDMVDHYSALVLYNTVLHTLYSASFSLGYSWPNSFTFSLGPVLKPVIDAVGLTLQFLSLGIGEWLVHLITLCFIKRWAFSVFIPLSMLLRIFPPSRGAGEALFAISFALAIFYPFIFLVDYEVHKMLELNLSDSSSSVKSFVRSSGIFGILTSVLMFMFLMGGVFIPFFLGGAVTIFFELLRNSVYYISLMSIMLPFINIFLTLTFAREIARVFQVDINFMSFLKII